MLVNTIRKIVFLTIPITILVHNQFAPLGQAATNQFQDPCQTPINPIVAENCLPGTQDWQITNYTEDIVGFASAPSVNVGETIEFFVDTDSAEFSIYVYRTGYYDGAGARLVASAQNLTGQVQPECNAYPDTGLVSCSNWSASYQLAVPAEWISGIYLAKLVRPDTGGESYILFAIRNDEVDSDIIYQLSDTTFQAYNNYGGKSVYSYHSTPELTVADAPRAVAVSLNRPSVLERESHRTYINTEYPMVYWLESQGYDVTYSTNMDTHQSGKNDTHNELLDHKIFLSVGHDEYWSQEMRDAITEARDAGVHLGFFSANTAYWRVRFEPDPYTNEADSVMVCYKTTEGGIADPSGLPTTTFRDPSGVNDPENSLLGVQYIGHNDFTSFPLQISSELAQDQIYRNTGLDQMPPGTVINLGYNIMGWEWDAVADNGASPDNLEILATTPVFGTLLGDYGSLEEYYIDKAVVHTTRYIAPSGAIVFASGTIRWAWGLALIEPNLRLQQITYNILADMGVQPATPSTTLVLDGDLTTQVPPPDDSELVYIPKGENAPDISLTTEVLDITHNTATISWQTDRDTRGEIWLSDYSVTKEASYNDRGNFDANGEPFTHHQLTLTDLSPDTAYNYQLVVWDELGNITVSPSVQFRTEVSPFFQERVLGILSSGKDTIRSILLEMPYGQELLEWYRSMKN